MNTNEKAIVFYCKDCGALFFAVMQNVAEELGQSTTAAAKARSEE